MALFFERKLGKWMACLFLTAEEVVALLLDPLYPITLKVLHKTKECEYNHDDEYSLENIHAFAPLLHHWLQQYCKQNHHQVLQKEDSWTTKYG